MVNIVLVFYVVSGVQLHLSVQWEAKHYDENTLDAAGKTLADALSLEFDHWEYAE